MLIRSILGHLCRSVPLFGALLIPFSLIAQIEYGGRPYSWGLGQQDRMPEAERMPPVDEEQLLKEDRERRRSSREKPLRFAYNHRVDFGLANGGILLELPNGGRIWKLRIRSSGARSLNFGFGRFRLAEGARVFIYDPERRTVLGAFTHRNNKASGRLPTGLIPGDEAVVELYEPERVVGKSELRLTRVSHAYRDVFAMAKEKGRDFGDAGDCNMNVNCPDGQPLQDQKRSVAMIVNNGDRFCSGALVNNIKKNGKPYFLTANHCFDGSASGWVFMFNYESPDCSDQKGPTDQSVAGGTLRARHPDSDFCLLELSKRPPLEYEVFYAGWDNSGDLPDSTVSIHHPSGDIKKISFDDDAPESSSGLSGVPDSEWKILEWDRNTTTEGGSSGGPLFDQDHRVVGQLHGGDAQCSNSVNDFFGKFSMSWDNGNVDTGRLKDWLAPDTSGVVALDGYDPNQPRYSNDGAIIGLERVVEVLCDSSTLRPIAIIRNQGKDTMRSLDLSVKVNDSVVSEKNWTGALASLEVDSVPLGPVSLSMGCHTLEVLTAKPNGEKDPNDVNDTVVVPVNVQLRSRDHTLSLDLDCYGSETYWEVKDSTGKVLFSADPGTYSGTGEEPVPGGGSVDENFCLSEGCYDLLIGDTYGDGMNGSQWNACGVDGDFHLITENGDTLGSMGASPNFGTDTTISFCVKPSGIKGGIRRDDLIELYPNPVDDHLMIRSSVPHDLHIRIRNAMGRLVQADRIGGKGVQRIALRDLSAGIYIVQVLGGGRDQVEKIRVR